MANVGSIGKTRYVEDWLTDNISTTSADGICWVNSSDTSDTAFARAAAAGKGLHCTGALTTTDNNLIELCHDTAYVFGQDGCHSIEVLMMLDDVTNVAFNIGFNDDSLDASNSLPAELATATWTTNAATFVGLVYDVDATNDDLHCMWVDDDNDSAETLANLRMNGMAPANSTWCSYRVEIQDRGSGNGVRAIFTFTDSYGRSCEKTFDTTVDRDCALVPYIGVENRSASAHNVYIKRIILEHTDP